MGWIAFLVLLNITVPTSLNLRFNVLPWDLRSEWIAGLVIFGSLLIWTVLTLIRANTTRAKSTSDGSGSWPI